MNRAIDLKKRGKSMIDGRRFEVMELGKEESYSFRNQLIDWEHYEMNLSEMIWQPI